MRAIVLRRSGPPHMLRVEEIPDPVARPGEVLVQVKAAGVNFADVLARQGLYPDAPQRPFIPGFETGGGVFAVGERGEGVPVGEGRLAHYRAGGYGEHIHAPAPNAHPDPGPLRPPVPAQRPRAPTS